MDKFRLSVSVDAGDTDYLARTHIKGNIVHAVLLFVLAVHAHISDLENNILRLCRLLFHDKPYISADHHV